MVKQERSDKRKSNIVGASQSAAAKKETKKRFQNEAFQWKQTTIAERAQKMAERESIEAEKAIERKQKKDQRDWDAALLVEERLLKKQEKKEKDKKGTKSWPSNKKRKQRRNRKRKKRKENKQMPHPP
jgi:hypothetical protein